MEVVDAALHARDNIFLTGNAGCGKTVTLLAILDGLQRRYQAAFRRAVAVCAPTGIAATHLSGRTIHSRLMVGMVRRASDFLNALQKRNVRQLRTLEVLVIDEISMVSAEMFECLSWFLGQARGRPELPFGGVQVIVCGDFGQLQPIAAGSEAVRAFQVDAFLNRGYAFQAPVWRRSGLRSFHLQKIWRQEDAEFSSLLNRIKVGDEAALEELLARCGRPLPAEHGVLPTELFGTNNEADALNERSMAALARQTRQMVAADRIDPPTLSEEARERWLDHEFFRDCPAPALLRLKVGAQVMLVKNLETDAGGRNALVNGARGVVVRFTLDGLPVVEFRSGRVEEMPETEFEQEVADHVVAVRRQVPLRMAWGITHFKSQGMSLDCARVSLDRVFAHGQAYVALSRARSMDGLEIRCGSKRPSIRPSPDVMAFYEDMDGYDGTVAWERWMQEHPIPFLERAEQERV